MHIQQVVQATKKPCHFCGEMAADPVVLPLLIGMGFSSFSLSPYHLPALRSVLKTIRYDELCYQQKQATQVAMIKKLKAMRGLVLQKESTAKYM
jgi:phosphotransferase system enzyme I (PtsI)